MQTFLEKTVQHLLQKYPGNISDLCIVLPNRRAGLFLKKHLAKSLTNPIWLPAIFSSEDFIVRLSGLEILDDVSLLFELYNIHKQIKADEAESFDEFSKWAQILLHDFNEIDRYLIDAKKLYSSLKDVKEIENWSLNLDSLTEFQQNYLSFWDTLGIYYQQLTASLISKKQAYQGLAYRLLAENIEEKIKLQQWHKIVFAGFNALNTAEEKIIRSLVHSKKAEVLWDADVYYTQNKQQEAGKFIRKYRDAWSYIDDVSKAKDTTAEKKAFLWEEDNFSTDNKQITVIGVAKNIAQAKVAGDLISKWSTQTNDFQKTAIVLADENLLFPVLHSLPENMEDVNVTMGYPMKNTPIAGLVELLFNLHETGKRLGKSEHLFYHKDVIQFLHHPYIHILLSDELNAPVNQTIIHSIREKNNIFVSVEEIEAHTEKLPPQTMALLKPFFKTWTSIDDALQCFYYLVSTLKKALRTKETNEKNSQKTRTNVELEYIHAFEKIIKRIKTLCGNYDNLSEIKTLHRFMVQIIHSTTFPFYGEPLTGLQVMGMLETRTLDFETVILLSANENILPAGKSQNSFIPFDLKKIFKLPSHNDKDAVFAYHFYRLLQRAKNIYLIYNTEADTFGNGEKSRFITQLLYELPKLNKNTVIKEQLLNLSISESSLDEIVIEKTEDILQKIEKKGEDGFSPSLLNTYRNCSLQFYFQFVAGLKEKEELEETIGAAMLGTVIHEVLQKMYEPFISKKLSADDVKQMKKQVEELTQQAFLKEYSIKDLTYGKNLLTLKVAHKFIGNFLDKEIELIQKNEEHGKPLIIKALEQNLKAEVQINLSSKEETSKNVTLKGTADRIDSLGSIIRLIDYKTGLTGDNEIKIKEWEQIQNDPAISKGFQLLMYALMYQKSAGLKIDKNLQSGIITFRELSAGLKPLVAENENLLTDEILEKFEEQLKLLLSDIYNPETPFSQTTSIDNCTYCNYRMICNR